MSNLSENESACPSEHKKDFCENCKRNLDTWNIIDKQKFSKFNMTKNLKTKPISYKCDGYIRISS